MGQSCSAEESSRGERRRKLAYGTGALLHDPNVSIRAGARVRISDRQVPTKTLLSERAHRAKGIPGGRQDTAITGVNPRGLFGSGDEEDVQFLDAVKGLVDGAVKLAGAERGFGARIMSGLFRKTGFVDSFVDSIVSFVNRRLQSLTEALAPKDVAVAVAARLRNHVEAHDKTTEALGIKAGRRHHAKTKHRQSDTDSQDAGKDAHVGGEADQDGEEEDEVQVVRLWRQWKRSGGFWPEQLPDPEHPAFDGEDEDGTREFLSQLDDGVDSFLLDLAKHVLHTALPEDADELNEAVGATTTSAQRGPTSRGLGDQDIGKAAADTAKRLSQLKSSVLEPMLVQILREQVIRLFCESSKAWQLLLKLWCPSAELESMDHGLDQPEAFSLMAGTLMQLEGGKGGSLRMTLLQGLVKMTWSGSSREEQGASSRGLPPALGQTDSGAKSARPAFLSDGSQHSLLSREDRSGSFESGADWSEVGSEFGGGDASPRSGAGSMFGASDASLPRSLASPITSQGGVGSVPEGARDIFSMPYTEQLSRGLVGDKGEKFVDEVEERALEALKKAWEDEMKQFPLAKCFFPTSWVMDRVRAARSMARRPTNLMIALSALDAAKDVLRGASDKRLDTKRAKARAAAASTAAFTDRSGPKEQAAMDRGNGEQEERNGEPDSREVEEDMPRRGLLNCPRTEAGKRDTPGWRAWEARREWFFSADVSKVGLHFGRSLLGEETMMLANVLLKSISMEYQSVEAIVRKQCRMAMQKCTEVDSADMVVSMKPVSTQSILYVSAQMRMLRALKKTGLDFSKSMGNGPQKNALSRRFKSCCWLFTDSLLKKLVGVKTKERARSRALEFGGDARDSSQRDQTRALDLQRETVEVRGELLREISGFQSSKDLLNQLILSWLPEVLQADAEEKEMAERKTAARDV